jgi:hypothetical protein
LLLCQYHLIQNHIEKPINTLFDKVWNNLSKIIKYKVVKKNLFSLFESHKFLSYPDDLCCFQLKIKLKNHYNSFINSYTIILRLDELLMIYHHDIDEVKFDKSKAKVYKKIIPIIFNNNLIDAIKYYDSQYEKIRFFKMKNSSIDELSEILNLKSNIPNIISKVVLVISKDELLSLSNQEIVLKISQFIETIFSFVLLLDSDDPQKEVYQYLNIPTYPIENLIEHTNLEETELNQYIKTLKRKKHIIFQGSPGTGKTYLAKHIANHLTSSGDGFYELIQFHPSYSYEDFIQGIRPQTSSDGNLEYSMIPGRFLDFCKQAEDCQDMCILIIDEINRANLSQVFGELMYLLEYREEKIQLAGSDQPFKIPDNVYIIGTMNTADRSIALVDHALRRRFAFIPIKPNYNILKKYHEKHNPDYDIESLINILIELNETINNPNYEIGVSFFLTETLKDDIEDIWIMEIEPYLEEYFFDETDKIDQFSWTKIKDKLKL